ncbi:unnamed protein product [Prunus armeniaca]|uniref:Cathepsin propeptide inhibitor domain-containing protein n=1 Tax=Prunus armeniaca TaxID=36596 RepID=A0A6J5TJA2_PRUAR|nr:unnamed protein product [Prunus armeniaca]
MDRLSCPNHVINHVLNHLHSPPPLIHPLILCLKRRLSKQGRGQTNIPGMAYEARENLQRGEEDRRFEIIKDNLRFIDEHNAQDRPYKVGLNTFANLTNQEYRAKFLGTRSDPKLRVMKAKNPSQRMVEALVCTSDWLKVGKFSFYKDPTKEKLELFDALEKIETAPFPSLDFRRAAGGQLHEVTPPANKDLQAFLHGCQRSSDPINPMVAPPLVIHFTFLTRCQPPRASPKRCVTVRFGHLRLIAHRNRHSSTVVGASKPRAFYQSMEKRRWLVFVVFTWMFVFSAGRELKIKHKDRGPIYNHTLATILVRYASTVYLSDLTELFTWTCSRCDGLIKDFEMIELVVDIQHCLQAFVGVAQDPNAIIIAFRGTQEHSIQNWVEDLFWKQLDLDYPGMPDAMVHHGFFNAYHNTTIRPGILNAIARAKEFYGDIRIIVTGHSMGGAMASFCALDLRVNQKERNVQVMTFGQPRIGNAAFASYFSELVPNTIRVTNEHDMVPHLPPYYTYFPQKTYHHFPREVWLYNVGVESLVYEVEKICDDSGEDPTCSRSVSGNSISDHLVYFGVELMAKTWRRCRIVMGPGVVEYSRTDLGGNFVLSRDLATPVLKMNAISEAGAKPL